MHLHHRVFSPSPRALAVTLLVCLLYSTPAWTQPTSQPLIQQSQVQYLGAFLLPQGTFGGSRFGYGGSAPTYFKDGLNRETMFMAGHDWYPGNVAQIQIPQIVNSRNLSQLHRASVLQPFSEITEGALGGNAGDRIGSLMVAGTRLLVGSYWYYDASVQQQTCIGDSSLTLSSVSDFRGFFAPSGTNPGRLGRYMTPVPTEWQSLLGGDALSGACCLSIISRTNSGPGVSAFQTSHVGSANPVPVMELLGYPLANPVRYQGVQGGCTLQNNVFNCTTTIDGVAFPTGTRSVLFFGSHGTGPVCYKDTGPSSCWGTGGYNAPPYRFQIWAYDANDLLSVKNGSRAPDSLSPYGIWSDSFPIAGARFAGATYDPISSRAFIVEQNGEDPIVHVLQIGTGSANPPPAPPTNLRVNSF